MKFPKITRADQDMSPQPRHEPGDATPKPKRLQAGFSACASFKTMIKLKQKPKVDTNLVKKRRFKPLKGKVIKRTNNGSSAFDNLKNYYRSMPKVKIIGRSMVPCALALQFPFSEPICNNYMEASYVANYKIMYRNKESYERLDPHDFHSFTKLVRLNVEDSYNQEGNRLFYSNISKEVTTTTCEEPNDPVLWHAIREIESKMGGTINMQYEALNISWTRVPHVQKVRDNYKLHVVDCESLGHRRCATCGIMNAFWIPGEDGLNGAFCGCCGSSLDEERETTPTAEFVIADQVAHHTDPMGAFQMAQMEIIEHLDGIGELQGPALQQAIQNDERVVRAMISRANVQLSFVDPGMTSEQRKVVNEAFRNYVIIDKVASYNPHAMLAAERTLMAQTMYEMRAHGQPILDMGGPSPMWKGLQNYHCISPILDAKDARRHQSHTNMPVHCTHTVETCDCMNGRKPLIISVDSVYDVSPRHVLSLMDRTNTTFFIYCVSTAAVDFSTSHGQLPWEQGLWIRNSEGLLTVLEGSSSVYCNDWEQSLWWTQADVIVTDGGTLCLQTLKVCGNHLMRVGIKCDNYKEVLQNTYRCRHARTDKSVCMMVPHWRPLLTPTLGIAKQWTEVQVNKELLKLLVVRASTGTVTYGDLVRYAVGLGYSKYNLKDKTVSMNFITADMALSHALIAKCIVDRQLLESRHILKFDRSYQTWRLRDPTQLAKMAGSLLVELGQYFLNRYLDDHKDKSYLISKLSGSLKDWLADPKWYDLLEQIYFSDIHELTVINANGKSHPSGGVQLCDHHTASCSHTVQMSDKYCRCCKLYKQEENTSYCQCCAHDSCEHKCSHKCYDRSLHSSGPKSERSDCECCGNKHNWDSCPFCNNNVDLELPIAADVAYRLKEAEKKAKEEAKAAKVANTEKLKSSHQDNEQLTSNMVPAATSEMLPKQSDAARDVTPAAAPLHPMDRNQVGGRPRSEILKEFFEQGMDDRDSAPESAAGTYATALQSQAQPNAGNLPTTDVKPINEGETKDSEKPKSPNEDLEADQVIASDHADEAIKTIMELNKAVLEDHPVYPEGEELQAALTLANLTSMEYAHIILKNQEGWDGVETQVFGDNKYGMSELKYVPMGITHCGDDDFTLVHRTDVSGAGNMCGFNCVNETIGVDRELWNTVMESRNNFTNYEIVKYCQAVEQNVLVLARGANYLARFNAQNDNFMVVRHCSLDSAPDSDRSTWYQHWQRANVKHKQCHVWVPSFYPWVHCKDISKWMFEHGLDGDFWDQSPITRLNLLIWFYSDNYVCSKVTDGFVAMLSAGRDGFEGVLYNNTLRRHEPDSYLEGVNMTSLGRSLVTYCLTPYDAVKNHPIMGQPINQHIPRSAQELEEWLVNELKCECIDYADLVYRTLVTNNREAFKEWRQVDVAMHGGRLRFSRRHHTKLKTGDVVMFRIGNYTLTTTVTVTSGQVMSDKNYDGPKVTSALIGVNKQSHSSKMKLLMYTLSANFDIERAWKLLQDSTAIKGPGGSGKSTKLIQAAKGDYIILTKTSLSKHNLLNRRKDLNIKTMESYCNHPTTHDLFIIDEAGMFGLLDILSLRCKAESKLLMAGDTFQIGMVITHVAPGLREYKSAISFSHNTTELVTTYRYGESICRTLRQAGMTISSNTNEDTEIILLDAKELSNKLVLDLVEQYQIDIVLVFYQFQKDMLFKMHPARKVSTVHEFQGNEANNVLVLQAPSNASQSGVWNKPEYCLSALTRAKRRLVWLSAGVAEGLDLATRCGLSTARESTQPQPTLGKSWADIAEEEEKLRKGDAQNVMGGGVSGPKIYNYQLDGRTTRQLLMDKAERGPQGYCGSLYVTVLNLRCNIAYLVESQHEHYLVTLQPLELIPVPLRARWWSEVTQACEAIGHIPNFNYNDLALHAMACKLLCGKLPEHGDSTAVVHVAKPHEVMQQIKTSIEEKSRLTTVKELDGQLVVRLFGVEVGRVQVVGRHKLKLVGSRMVSQMERMMTKLKPVSDARWLTFMTEESRCKECFHFVRINITQLMSELTSQTKNEEWIKCGNSRCVMYQASISSSSDTTSDTDGRNTDVNTHTNVSQAGPGSVYTDVATSLCEPKESNNPEIDSQSMTSGSSESEDSDNDGEMTLDEMFRAAMDQMAASHQPPVFDDTVSEPHDLLGSAATQPPTMTGVGDDTNVGTNPQNNNSLVVGENDEDFDLEVNSDGDSQNTHDDLIENLERGTERMQEMLITNLYASITGADNRDRMMELLATGQLNLSGWIVFPRRLSSCSIMMHLLDGTPDGWHWTTRVQGSVNLLNLRHGEDLMLSLAVNRSETCYGALDGMASIMFNIMFTSYALEEWKMVMLGETEASLTLLEESMEFIKAVGPLPLDTVKRHMPVVLSQENGGANKSRALDEVMRRLTSFRPQCSEAQYTHSVLETSMVELPMEENNCCCGRKCLNESSMHSLGDLYMPIVIRKQERREVAGWIHVVQMRQLGGIKSAFVAGDRVVHATTFGGCSVCAGLKISLDGNPCVVLDSVRWSRPKVWLNRRTLQSEPNVIVELLLSLGLHTILLTDPYFARNAITRNATTMDEALIMIGLTLTIVERVLAGWDWLNNRWHKLNVKLECDQYHEVNKNYIESLRSIVSQHKDYAGAKCFAKWNTGTIIVGLPTMWKLNDTEFKLAAYKGKVATTEKIVSVKLGIELVDDALMFVETMNHRMTVIMQRDCFNTDEFAELFVGDAFTKRAPRPERQTPHLQVMGAIKLNLSADYHREHNTAVNLLLNERKTRLIQAQLIGPHQAVYFTPVQIRDFGADLGRRSSNHNLVEHGTWIPNEGVIPTAEQLACKLVASWTGKDGLCAYYGTYSYIPVVNSTWNMRSGPPLKYTPLRRSSDLAMNGALNLLITSINNLKEKKEKVAGFELTANEEALIKMCGQVQLGGCNPWMSERVVQNCDKALIGVECLSLEMKALAHYIQSLKCREVFILLPMMGEPSNRYHKFSYMGTELLWQALGSTEVITIDEGTYGHLNRASGIRVADVVMHVEHSIEILGMRLVSVMISAPTLALPKFYSPCVRSNENIIEYEIQIPELTFKHNMFHDKVHTVQVDQRLYRHLSFRVLSSDCDFEDLLAYTRTYLQTITYTQNGFYSENLNDLSNLHTVCACVLNEYTVKKLGWLGLAEEKVGFVDAETSKVIERLKSNVLDNILRLLDIWKVEQSTVSDIKEFLKHTLGETTTKVASKIADLCTKKVERRRQIYQLGREGRVTLEKPSNCESERHMPDSHDVLISSAACIVHGNNMISYLMQQQMHSNYEYWSLHRTRNTNTQVHDGLHRKNTYQLFGLELVKHEEPEIRGSDKLQSQNTPFQHEPEITVDDAGVPASKTGTLLGNVWNAVRDRAGAGLQHTPVGNGWFQTLKDPVAEAIKRWVLGGMVIPICYQAYGCLDQLYQQKEYEPEEKVQECDMITGNRVLDRPSRPERVPGNPVNWIHMSTTQKVGVVIQEAPQLREAFVKMQEQTVLDRAIELQDLVNDDLNTMDEKIDMVLDSYETDSTISMETVSSMGSIWDKHLDDTATSCIETPPDEMDTTGVMLGTEPIAEQEPTCSIVTQYATVEAPEASTQSVGAENETTSWEINLPCIFQGMVTTPPDDLLARLWEVVVIETLVSAHASECAGCGSRLLANELCSHIMGETTVRSGLTPYACEVAAVARKRVVFNPITQGNCVVNCLHRTLEHMGLSCQPLENACELLGRSMWLNGFDATAICWLLGLECSLTFVDQVTTHNTGVPMDGHSLERLRLRDSDHCQLITCKKVHGRTLSIRQLPLSQKTKYELGEQIGLVIGEPTVLTTTLSDLNGLINGAWTERFLKKYNPSFTTESEWLENRKLTGQKHTINKKRTPMYTGEWAKCGELLHMECVAPSLNSGQCVLITDGIFVHLGFVIGKSNNGVYVYNAQCIINPAPMMFVISARWAKSRGGGRAENRLFSDIEGVTALNQATARWMVTQQMCVATPNIQDPKCTTLVVADYDNRAHHKYDEGEFLKAWPKAQCIIINNEPKLFEADELYLDRGLLTPILENGKGKIVLRCSNNITVSFISKLLSRNRIKNSATKMVIFIQERMSILRERDVENHIKRHCSEVDFVATLNKFNPGTHTLTSEEELCQLLQITDPDLSVAAMVASYPVIIEITNRQHTPLAFREYRRSLIIKVHTNTFVRSGYVNEIKIKPNIKGGSWMEFSTVTAQDRWWRPQETDVSGGNLGPTHNVNAMVGAVMGCVNQVTSNASQQTHSDRDNLIVWMDTPAYVDDARESEPCFEVVPAQIIDMWETTDLTGWIERYGPLNNFSIKNKSVADRIMTSYKSTLVQYPLFTRPVFTKLSCQEFNAVSGRLGHFVQYRKGDYDVHAEVLGIAETFFRPDWREVSRQHKADPITFNQEATRSWLQSRPNVASIVRQVNEILSEGLQLHPINSMNVHLKLEALLKSNPAIDHRQTKARVLVWQDQGLCAIFSPQFKVAKDRLKEQLGLKTVYADGLRPDQLSLRVQQADPAKYIVENDLEQQDRQTDEKLLDIEMGIYELLGVDVRMLSLWRKCHDNWYFRGKSTRGERNWMRLTGQATTAIGNAITNLCVHWRLCRNLNRDWKLFILLGDDGALLTDRPLDPAELKSHGKTMYNMIMKPSVSTQVGTFCCFNVYKTSLGKWALGPDVVRLRRRFEVTNGVSEATDINHKARTMSYCCMLGDITPARRVIEQLELPIEPVRWYNWGENASATDLKYNKGPGYSESELRNLTNMMASGKYTSRGVKHWTESV